MIRNTKKEKDISVRRMTLSTSDVHLFVVSHLVVREQNARLDLDEYYSFQYGLDFEYRNVWANSADPDQTAPRGAV